MSTQYRIVAFCPTGLDMFVVRPVASDERDALEALARRFAQSVGGEVVHGRFVPFSGFDGERLDFTVEVAGQLSYFAVHAPLPTGYDARRDGLAA